MPIEAFGPLLKRLLAERRLSISAFARLVRMSRNMVDLVARGGRLPPLDRLNDWAEVLTLGGKDRDRFVFLGHVAHSTDFVRQRLEDLQTEVDRHRYRGATVKPKPRPSARKRR